MLEKRTLPAKYYVDESYFQEELEKHFFGQWICVGRAEQISRPGNYFLREVRNESLILTRDESGKPHAFYNVCRHRGTRLCDKSEGVFSGRIACPYHAWTYALDGKLTGAPQMSEVAGFCATDFPLNEVRCEEWDGHVFVNFSKSSETLRDHLGALYEKFRPWRSEDLRLGKRIVYNVKANWKLIVQNYSECLHCPVIHPTLKKLSHYLSGQNEAACSEYLGGTMTLNDGVDTMSVTGRTERKIFSGLDDHQKRHVYYYWINPNLLLSLHPDYLMTHTIWPKAPGLTDVVCEWHFHKDEVTRPGFNPEDAVQFWDEVNREDWHVSELSQLGISSRGYTPGPYSNREELLHGLDRLLTRT
jgi:glycine betaine catabolism A